MTDWHEEFRKAQEQMAQSATPVVAPDPPKMKSEWEKEVDIYIAQHHGEFTIDLPQGSRIRVTAKPGPATDAVEISVDNFKRLSRMAALLGAKVVRVMRHDEAKAEREAMEKGGCGFWVSKHVFIEIDKYEKEKILRTGGSEFGVVAAPTQPTTYPVVDVTKWMSISAGTIVEQVPMRIASGKVIGTVLKTTAGLIYIKKVVDKDHRIYGVNAEWAFSGGYMIDKEAFSKYLANSAAVIKFIRNDSIYFTTAQHIQKYGGVIKSWGSDRIVMPLRGFFWLVTDSRGEVLT